MSYLAVAPILKAMKAALAQPTEANIFALADAANLTIKKESLKIEVVEHTTKKGKVIRGVVRTDLSYAEAKAIDEFTFKKDGGWFIREKHLGVDIQAIDNQTTSTPQNEPVTTLQSDTLVKDEDNNIKGLERKFKPAAKKYKNPEINLEPKESAKLLKKTLTKLFPDTKFSVSMSRGTAYGSVSVSWTDGASYDLVNVIAQHFRGKGFDSSSDSTHYLNAINEDGKIVGYGLGYVSISRTYSREFLEKLQSSFSDMLQTMIKEEGLVIKGGEFNAYFDAKERWTQDKINEAKISHSTGKYNFGNVPQVANDDDFSLQSQTEAERLANELRIKAAEQAKQQVEEQARLKAQADKELNDFRLSGSSAPSDIAASYGQGDMFVQTRGQQKKGENNVPSTSNALESDIKPTSTPDSQQGIKNSNDDESGQLGRMARPSINRPNEGGGSQRDRSIGLSENDGISLGIGSDTSVFGVSGERGTGASNTTTSSSRSSGANESRTPINRERDSAVVRTATTTGSVTQNTKEAEQLKAEGTPTQWGDAQNIDKALPYLLPEQRDDVAKLEKRLIEDNKNGMLFTNGTGTGKTFTGLGAVKRFANAGKKNILIVSMNDKIIRDFVKSALSLNLDIHQLDGVTDNGKDKIVATTYANLAQNLMLGKRDWDLIIVDEAHNLMQGEQGKETEALGKLRALTGHHAGFYEWFSMRHGDKDKMDFVIGHSPSRAVIIDEDAYEKWRDFRESLRKEWEQTWTNQSGKTKVIFLTATPFSYAKTLEWGEGYLFDFEPPEKKFSKKEENLTYNAGSPREQFYMKTFGYKMRTNRLTRPDGRVDVGILERKFAEKLKTEGAMSGRELSVPFDYDRKFVLISSKVGEKIDEGFNYLWDTKGKNDKSKYSDLLRAINKRFDYLARLQLLEAIKAEEAIGQIKKHLALGRKVIVFHDYNVGGSTNPFVFNNGFSGNDAEAVESQYNEFKRERPDLINLKLDIPAPLVTLRRAFPNALMFNGTVSKGQRAKNADLFNSDDSGNNVMIAQSDAAATGISFHDTTGKHQRVIINIGMPTKPAKLRQTEGRIYRVGQASNAIQRYLTTGTGWERSAFAQKIAERAETVDNLAQGESAVVSIKDALVRAYEEAEYFEPSENDGIGGKAYDEENNRVMALSPFERAKTDYWVKQKITAKRGEREGKEWYATPEPVGLFMVNLAGAHSGDDILEPSAGDGAIGRYMPSDASVTFIEPSDSLASRARMNNTNANVIIDDFENHNSSNKYDAIVMNPPFGQGGSIAIKHLVKAFEHLREGGRVVALLPVGKMDELIVKYHEMGYFKDIYTVAEFALPSSTFKNAGTGVNTKIHVFEKHEKKADAPQGVIVKNLSHYDDIEDLFNAIENINIKPRKPRIDEALAEYGLEIYPDRSKYIITGEGLKRKDITSTLFGSYIEKNKDGDVVEKYNRSTAFLKWLKDSQIPNMAQFNQGLSANNLPIKYQQNTNKYNTWDGVGKQPDWLSTAINRYGKKLEDFTVEKPVYDSVTNNNPKEIIVALRQALTTPTDENIQALADVAGLSIKKPSPLLSSQDIKGLNKTLLLPENATKGDRKRAFSAWLKENLIKTSDDKVVRFNSDQSVKHLKYNGERNNLKAKVIPYIAEIFEFGDFVGRFPNDDHSNSNVFLAFHYYRKWCKVDDRELYLEAHAGEYENGSLELVAYNQKDITKLLGSDPSTLNISKDTQAEGLPNKENNKPVFDDAQVPDDLAVEDGDLVRILDVKALAVNDEPQPQTKTLAERLVDLLNNEITQLHNSYKKYEQSVSHTANSSRGRIYRAFEKNTHEIDKRKILIRYLMGETRIKNLAHDAYSVVNRYIHSAEKQKMESLSEDEKLLFLKNKIYEDVKKARSRLKNKEKPVYDAVGGIDPKAILAAMRQALTTPTDENIQALADVAGLRIKKVSVADLTAKDMRIAVSFNDARAQAKANASELNAQEQAVMDVMLKSGIYNFATLRDNNDFSKLADFSNEEFDTVGLILEDTKKELTKKVVKHILENSTDYPNAIGKNMVANSDLDGMDIAPLAKLAKIKKTAKTPDDLFKLMASSTANQDVRYYLTGVKVEDNGDLISTDGHSMTIIRDSGINREAGIYTTVQRLEGLKRTLLKQGKSQEEIDKEIKAQEDSFKEHKFPDYKRVYPRKNLVAAENIFNIDVAKLKGIVDSIVKAFRRVISNKFFDISLEFNQNKIFFNVQYLQNGLDLMASMGYKHVNFYLRDADSSVLIEPEDEKVSFVVMPMRNNRGFDAIKTINLNNIDDWNWSKSSFDDVDTDDDEEFEQEIEQLLFF